MTKRKITTENPASVYLDNMIKTMRKHGAEPVVPPETYEQKVKQVSKAFSGLRRSSPTTDS